MATTPKREHAFNVLFSDGEMSDLQRIADEWGQSKGAALRKMLKSARTMVLEEQATCASGIRCFVPHMHPQTPVPAPAAPPVPAAAHD